MTLSIIRRPVNQASKLCFTLIVLNHEKADCYEVAGRAYVNRVLRINKECFYTGTNRRMKFAVKSSFDADNHRIRGFSIYSQDNFYFTASDQAARDSYIGLIQTGKTALRTSV